MIRNNGKPTVQYAAQVHSNEPASCEGALAMMLSLTGGTTLGNYCMARRIMGQYTLASTVISYAADNAQKVLDTAHAP